MSPLYKAHYTPQSLNGSRGYWYRCYADTRLVFEGWSAGSRSSAEAEVREGIRAREALRALAAGTEAA